MVASVARSLGALTIGVVTRPFGFEGKRRAVQAETGIERLRAEVDTLIVIPNDRLLSISDRHVSVLDAFKAADQVLLSGVQGITDLITTPGLINLDFADVKSVMSGAGSALMGIGSSRGDDRAVAAAEMAISSPLLEASIDGAHGVLLSIQGGSDLGLFEINEAAQLVSNSAAVDANIIFGAVIDDALGDEVRVTVIAAGFDEQRPGRPAAASAVPPPRRRGPIPVRAVDRVERQCQRHQRIRRREAGERRYHDGGRVSGRRYAPSVAATAWAGSGTMAAGRGTGNGPAPALPSTVAAPGCQARCRRPAADGRRRPGEPLPTPGAATPGGGSPAGGPGTAGSWAPSPPPSRTAAPRAAGYPAGAAANTPPRCRRPRSVRLRCIRPRCVRPRRPRSAHQPAADGASGYVPSPVSFVSEDDEEEYGVQARLRRLRLRPRR